MFARLSQFLSLAAAIVAVNASVIRRDEIDSPGVFGFINPPTRGWDYTTASTGPCGGYTTANYTLFGMGTSIDLLAENEVSEVVISYSNSSDMSSAVTLASFSSITTGNVCFDDAISWVDTGYYFGDKITLQVYYHDDTTQVYMYQCADIEFTSDHAYESSVNYTCSNTSTLVTASGSTTSTSSSAATVTVTADASGLTSLQAGWVGACVTLAIIGLALGLGYYMGLVLFSKRSVRRQTLLVGHRRMGDHSLDDISLQRRTTVDQKQSL